MRRRVLVALVAVAAAGVLCAAAGAGLVLQRPAVAGFGWTAYSPLSHVRYAPYLPDGGAAFWSRALGAGLLALGAGATAAAGTALVLRRRAARAQ